MRYSIDTNIFAYLADERDLNKQSIARDLVETLLERDAWIGLQVVGELQNVLLRRFKKTISEASATASFVLGAFPSFAYDEDDVSRALSAFAGGRFSYWDALLLSAAARAGCGVLFTEDMQDGGRFDDVLIINPFAPDGGLSARGRELLELAN